MSFLLKFKPLLIRPSIIKNVLKTISSTTACQLKEIQVATKSNKLVVSATYKESPREQFLLPAVKQANDQKFCPECTLGLNIKHTDVLILSQYVRSDGCMLPRRITGLCKKQQKRIGTMVTMAQKAGLMPNLAPANSKKDPTKRREWKKFNKYYFESTIKA